MKCLGIQKGLVVFYGVLFLLVFSGIFGNALKANTPLTGKDASQFAVRGFHIDLRVQVMTMEALKSFAAELAGFGINTLVMEWEGTFPFEKHSTISNKYAYSREEVRSFISYCSTLGIEVIPLQQCFGHVEYILRHNRYCGLKESQKDLSQVCPSKLEENRQLFTELFSDMASLHPSKYFHIGCDETRLLGACTQCSEKVAREGMPKLIGDYLEMICEIVVGLGKVPVLWDDIILKYPGAVANLPKETVYVDWNYGWDINHFGDINLLLEKGLNFWGAPAIRSHPDNWYLTCWEKHFNNQRDFIPYARKAGYNGIVMTSWSTSGLYGYNWENNWEVVDMYAVRNVYPLSGFRILVAAYAQALKQEEPLNPSEFVPAYARGRFGFSPGESREFWQALISSPATVVPAKMYEPGEIERIRNIISEAKKTMDGLHPKSNKKEFEHIRLMMGLRKFYLDFKALEAQYESGNFTKEQAKAILPEAEMLLAEAEKLNRRFSSLNKGFLYPNEIREQNFIRSQKLKIIRDSLAGARK